VATAPAKTSTENQQADALEQSLRRQQAELARERKRLADQQTELSHQREQAQQAERVRAQQEEALERQRKQDEDEARKKKETADRAASQMAPPYSGPSSGTLVWEGEIDGADLIEIQDGSASRGTLRGALPGVPVMVQAFPANSVIISVPPGPSNDWRRIVLHVRTKGRKTVTATVHWVVP
jgi:multidrug efflux pump subunit AcrA (membrane-fusion protein)